ncbi:hypothetical protein [Iningainema tapete]|uniref:Uncharacterized protein n=1 Tax=Iningainema tapete BLCC-T55 TaxID=2748662 RepID=A0A8J6XIM0_9CYAN|nr:hypothetical protein [Iningainema tapete]MBD2777515.1 hypothetical protein [Iningainema tapete BLCC-T55]
MQKSIQDKAREQAYTDWKNKSSVFWVSGRLDPNKPVLSETQIFYPRFCFINTSEDEEFYQTYNQMINKLIDEKGIPDWAPIKRIPERAIVLEYLTKNGHNLSTFVHSSIAERNLVRSVLNKWTFGKPMIWSRIPQQFILLFGGNTTEKAGRVDVLDTEQMKWLATFEFLRKHYPNLPWDHQTNMDESCIKSKK